MAKSRRIPVLAGVPTRKRSLRNSRTRKTILAGVCRKNGTSTSNNKMQKTRLKKSFRLLPGQILTNIHPARWEKLRGRDGNDSEISFKARRHGIQFNLQNKRRAINRSHRIPFLPTALWKHRWRESLNCTHRCLWGKTSNAALALGPTAARWSVPARWQRCGAMDQQFWRTALGP